MKTGAVQRALLAVLVMCCACGITRTVAQVAKEPLKEPAEETLEKSVYEALSLRVIVQDMAKRAGTTATFDKNVEPTMLDRKVTLSMSTSTVEYAALLMCEALDLTIVAGEKGWRVASPVKGKVKFEDLPLKQALEDLAKRAGTTVSFKDIDDEALRVPVTCGSYGPSDLALWARIICEDLSQDWGITISVRENSWVVTKGKARTASSKVVLSEEDVKGRWRASLGKVEAATALLMIGKATKTELAITDERTDPTDTRKLSDKMAGSLYVEYATPDHLIREVSRQARFVVRFVPGDAKKGHRYEILWTFW